jgi:hypothetical protein
VPTAAAVAAGGTPALLDRLTSIDAAHAGGASPLALSMGALAARPPASSFDVLRASGASTMAAPLAAAASYPAPEALGALSTLPAVASPSSATEQPGSSPRGGRLQRLRKSFKKRSPAAAAKGATKGTMSTTTAATAPPPTAATAPPPTAATAPPPRPPPGQASAAGSLFASSTTADAGAGSAALVPHQLLGFGPSE